MSKELDIPAFPNVPSDPQYEKWDEGMMLRDYFAAKAMQGWLSSFPEEETHPSSVGTELQIAREAYKIADVMLKARNE